MDDYREGKKQPRELGIENRHPEHNDRLPALFPVAQLISDRTLPENNQKPLIASKLTTHLRSGLFRCLHSVCRAFTFFSHLPKDSILCSTSLLYISDKKHAAFQKANLSHLADV